MRRGFKAIILLLTIILGLTVLPVQFQVSAEETDTAQEKVINEKEGNNSIKKANKIEFGVVTVGKLKNNKDVDYFKMTTTVTADINFEFSHEANSPYAYCWYAQVLDKDKKVINEGTLSGKEASSFSVSAVNAGTYYLKISPISGGNPLTNGFSNAEYRLTITSKCQVHGELTDWITTVEPSCAIEGERIQNCTVCNTAVVTEVVAKLEHSFTDWSIVKDAELLQIGQKKHTCVLCGEVENKYFLATTTIIALISIGVIVLLIIILVAIKRKRSYKPSYKSSSSSYSKSSSSSSSYSGSSYSGSSYSGSSYSGDSYSSSSDSYDYYKPSYDGQVTMGGETYGVHTYDAEGYKTAPYIEDAEGYKTYVDPDSVEPTFNWLDM